MTLLELLVTIGILGTLSALLLVGVQAARETSRRMTCLNHLRQLGLAVETYHGAHRHFPPRGDTFIQLLAFIGEATDRQTSPAVYLCPSDPLAVSELGYVSYRFNEGYAGQIFGANGVMPDLSYKRLVRARDVTDGLSNTAGLSEQLILLMGKSPSHDDILRQPLRTTWYVGPGYSAPTTAAVRAFLDVCPRSRTWGRPIGVLGGYWFLKVDFGYNHMLGPNHACCHNGSPGDFHDFLKSIAPPASLHKGGVNLAMLDGSARFVVNAIDPTVWHAWGTRHGGEPLAQE